MLSDSTFQDLLQEREALEAILATNPVYKELQAVNTLVEIHEAKREGRASDGMIPHNLYIVSDRKDVRTSRQERDHIAASAMNPKETAAVQASQEPEKSTTAQRAA